MNTKYIILFLIGSIVASLMFTSCGKIGAEDPYKVTDNSNNDDDGNDDDGNGDGDNDNLTGTFTDTRDNKKYKWVKIGNQTWMAENLAYTGNNGYQQHQENPEDWDGDLYGWCYLDNDHTNRSKYGVLYQYKAAMEASPNGWHLPNDAEWNQLVTYLKENAYSYDGIIGNNTIAKSLATDYDWFSCSKEGSVGNTDFPDYRNKSGFSALPSGSRNCAGDGFFGHEGKAVWWSSTHEKDVFGYIISCSAVELWWSMDCLNIYDSAIPEKGYSVRCVKN